MTRTWADIKLPSDRRKHPWKKIYRMGVQNSVVTYSDYFREVKRYENNKAK